MREAVNSGNEAGKVPSVLIRSIPDDLHRRLRVCAAYLGESLSAFALRAVMHEVERVERQMGRERGKGEGR